MRLPGAVDGREGAVEAAGRSSGEPASGLLRYMSPAVAVSDQGMNLPSEQINPSQQAEPTMPFVLMIARESRVDAGLGRQIGRGRCNGLESWFFVVGDDGYRLARFLRFGSLFQDLDLAIIAQNLRHLLLELDVATFQIIPYLVRLDFLLTEYLAHRSLHQFGETFVNGRGCTLFAEFQAYTSSGMDLDRTPAC
jgi:hypothetical protein